MIWKNISSRYEISEYGHIRNTKSGRVLKLYMRGKYLKVKFRNLNKGRETHTLHILVALLFVDNPQKKPFVNHIDGDTLNNHYTNLEWCTAKENVYHARHISRNSAVISVKKMKNLDKLHPNISKEELLKLFIEEAS